MINPFDAEMKIVAQRFLSAFRDITQILTDLTTAINKLRVAMVDLADQLNANTEAQRVVYTPLTRGEVVMTADQVRQSMGYKTKESE